MCVCVGGGVMWGTLHEVIGNKLQTSVAGVCVCVCVCVCTFLDIMWC